MIITVAGSKGGVGKTTVAINLGVCLRHYGSAIIVDGNISSPQVGSYLGSPHLAGNIAQALRQNCLEGNIYSHKFSGLNILPGTYNEKIDAKNIERFATALKNYDTVIIDSSPHLHGEGHHSIKAAEAVLAVTTPDLPSVLETMRTVKHAKLHGKNVLGVVVNKSKGAGIDLPAANIASITEAPVLGVIPDDDNVAEALRYGHPVVCRHQHAPATIAFRELADNIVKKGLWK